MSEQLPPQPLYIVVSNIRAVTLCMRDEKGDYKTVCQMQYPFDRPETALQLCDLLMAIDVPLLIPGTKP